MSRSITNTSEFSVSCHQCLSHHTIYLCTPNAYSKTYNHQTLAHTSIKSVSLVFQTEFTSLLPELVIYSLSQGTKKERNIDRKLGVSLILSFSVFILSYNFLKILSLHHYWIYPLLSHYQYLLTRFPVVSLDQFCMIC